MAIGANASAAVVVAGYEFIGAKNQFKHMGPIRFDSFIVLIFCFDNLESKFTIELYGTFIIYLHMSAGNQNRQNGEEEFQLGLVVCVEPNFALVEYLQIYAIKVTIFFDIVQYVIDHDRTDAKSSIWIQATQCHDV